MGDLGLPGKLGAEWVRDLRRNAIHATEDGGVTIDDTNADGTWLSVTPVSGCECNDDLPTTVGAHFVFNDIDVNIQLTKQHPPDRNDCSYSGESDGVNILIYFDEGTWNALIFVAPSEELFWDGRREGVPCENPFGFYDHTGDGTLEIS